MAQNATAICDNGSAGSYISPKMLIAEREQAGAVKPSTERVQGVQSNANTQYARAMEPYAFFEHRG